MPIERVKEYLTRPYELLPTWQAILLGFLKVVLLAAVTGSIHTIVNEEIMASVYKTKAQVKLIQHASAAFPTADGLMQKQLFTYELSACDTVTNVAVEIDFDEGTELHEYNVTYSDGTEGGFEHRLLGQTRVSFALQRDLKKNRKARIDLLISKRVPGSKGVGEPGKMPDIQIAGKTRRGEIDFAVAK